MPLAACLTLWVLCSWRSLLLVYCRFTLQVQNHTAEWRLLITSWATELTSDHKQRDGRFSETAFLSWVALFISLNQNMAAFARPWCCGDILEALWEMKYVFSFGENSASWDLVMRGDEARNFIGFDATWRIRESLGLLLRLAQISRLLRKGIQAESSSEWPIWLTWCCAFRDKTM